MPTSLRLRILQDGLVAFETTLATPLELGRQRQGEDGPYAEIPASGDHPARLVIAAADEENCSRRHISLLPLPDGLVRISNGSKLPLAQSSSTQVVPPGGSVEWQAPFALILGHRTIAVWLTDLSDEFGMQSLDGQTLAPGMSAAGSRALQPAAAHRRVLDDDAVGWLRQTINVLQSAVGSADFLAESAAAMVQILGLDSGRVLLWQEDDWIVKAVAGRAEDDGEWRPSRHVLERLRSERRTFMKRLSATAAGDSPSLVALQGVVAAPLVDAKEQVIGALYGERQLGGPAPIFASRIEAMLVELLACGVAAGLARLEHQAVADKRRLQFEQFFGKELADHLQREPELLDGRETEVTLLFCDVRGYSKASEALGPAGTVRWINDVMTELSRCVLAERGVLVDYIGDELFAMWGAPEPQANQAERAARAALAMRAALADLNARWQETLKGAMDVGLGLNTGIARVGNTGSEFKFKYGPLGNAVNLASRVQGLTKYLRCRPLATASTRKKLGASFLARRVCKVRVVNIEEPVDLYEVDLAGSAERQEFFRASEAALDALEIGHFATAARRAAALLDTHVQDGPLLLVLARASTMLMTGGAFDPVWEPPGK